MTDVTSQLNPSITFKLKSAGTGQYISGTGARGVNVPIYLNGTGTPIVWHLVNGKLTNVDDNTQPIKVINEMGYLGDDGSVIVWSAITREPSGSYRFYGNVPGYGYKYLANRCNGWMVGFDNPTASTNTCEGMSYDWIIETVSGNVAAAPVPAGNITRSPAPIPSPPPPPPATTPAPAPAPVPAEEDKGMSGGAIAGIVVGIILFFLLIGVGVYMMKKKKAGM